MGLALACTGQSALAQGFEGTATFQSGTGTITPGVDSVTITVDQVETVIDWQPNDVAGTGNIDFLPDGQTATYLNFQQTEYTVLNRILPTDGSGNAVARAVEFNGLVESFIDISTIRSPAGNIWFYSPTGIVVGSTGAFNVGSLVLTTNDIVFGAANTGGTVLFGPAGQMLFRGSANSTGFVQIDPGAQITAAYDPAFGIASYVAMVAPRVVQGGTVSSNGGIAYVAAEQADITINAGVFDIAIGAGLVDPSTVGTTDANGVVHTGTSTGPASTGVGDVQRISMVALPKNTALTMLLSGNIGYAPAAVAANDGSAVVLSAGYATDTPSAQAANNLGNVQIGNTVFTNRVDGYASGSISVAPTGGTTDFQALADLYAQQSIALVAEAGETIQSAQDLLLRSADSGVGGVIDILSQGGDISVGNLLLADASNTAGPFFTPVAADGVGGAVTVSATGGTISAVDTQLFARGTGYTDVLPTGGSDGFGGSILVNAGPGGTLSLGDLFADASGIGGFAMQFGGDGFGGSISILDQGGLLDFGLVDLVAAGLFGNGDAGGGNGTGGQVSIDLTSLAHSWTSLFVDASADGAFPSLPGTSGGSATADANAISLSISGGASLDVVGSVELNADANAGYDGVGLTGQAGGIAVDITNGDLTVGTQFWAHANASIGFDPPPPPIDIAPDLTGGNVQVSLDSGNLTATETLVEAEAMAFGANTTAGTGLGGTAAVSLANGSDLTLAGVASGIQLHISADALGISGPLAPDAIAGTAALVSDGSQVNVADITLVTASALPEPIFNPGLAQPEGFNGTGGSALIDVSNSAFVLGQTVVGAVGFGDQGAVPGTATGGSASFIVNDTLTGTATRTIDALNLTSTAVGAGPTVAGSTLLQVEVLSATAPVSVLGDFTVSAQGATAPAGDGFTATISGVPFTIGGNAVIDTSRDVTMTVNVPGSFDVAGTLDIAARQVTASGPITAGGNTTITAPLGIIITDLAVGGTTDLLATGGVVIVSNDLSSTGQVTVQGTSVNLRSLSALDIADVQATAGDIVLTVAGAASDLVLAQADATGSITGSSADGAIAVTGPVDAGGAVTFTAGTDATITGDVTAGTTADFIAGGTLTVDATVLAASISGASSGVDLGAGAQLGSFGTTQSVTLTNNSASGGTFVGGADVAGAYSLTQAELDRISADIAITIASSGSGLFSVGDLTVATGAGGSLGNGGTLSLISAGDMFVAGTLAMQTSDPASTLQLIGQQVLVSADTGSVIVADAGGALTGTLAVDAESLIVASDASLADLGGGTTDVTIASDRLGIADGAASDAGYLQADMIDISVIDSVYVQNSGASDAFDDRRGFTANALNIDTASTATQIAINGVILDAGGAVTGLDTTPLITINDAPAAAGGQFAPLSTVNGCIIGLACRLTIVPLDPQSEDQLTGVTPEGNPSGGDSLIGGSTIIEIREDEPLITPPLVDEPITGVGNDDLWLRDCDPETDDSCKIVEEAQ